MNQSGREGRKKIVRTRHNSQTLTTAKAHLQTPQKKKVYLRWLCKKDRTTKQKTRKPRVQLSFRRNVLQGRMSLACRLRWWARNCRRPRKEWITGWVCTVSWLPGSIVCSPDKKWSRPDWERGKGGECFTWEDHVWDWEDEGWIWKGLRVRPYRWGKTIWVESVRVSSIIMTDCHVTLSPNSMDSDGISVKEELTASAKAFTILFMVGT